MNWKRIPAAMLLLVVLLVPLTVTAQDELSGTPADICAAATPAADAEVNTFTEPEPVLEVGVDYRAIFCTEAGPIYIDLLEDFTPVTVNNFVFLAQSGYYNNTTFHRVIEQFMAQGGDPSATGSGGPGYQFQDEIIGFLTFDQPGLLAMANAGPGTNGSQFFITTVPTPHLDGRHTIFGRVLEGQENVEALRLRDPQQATEAGSSLDTVVIITDPDNVETTYEPAEAGEVSSDDVSAALGVFAEQIADVLPADNEQSGVFTTGEAAGDDEAFGEVLSSNNHSFRVVSRLVNASCTTDIVFTHLQYTIDAYATAEDAGAALASGTYFENAVANGFTELETNTLLPFFTRDTETCDGGEGVEAVSFFRRGRYIASLSVIFPTAAVQAPLTIESAAEAVLVDLQTQFYDAALADIYSAEIR